jgi:superfamily II DNA or RNA helicase
MPLDLCQELSDRTIQRTVGPRSFVNGMAYAQAGEVSGLRVDAETGLLWASVQGTRRTPYSVLVSATKASGRWAGQCTCPVAFDCKHVAAVMITARERAGADRAVDHQPGWESAVGALVRARAAPLDPSASNRLALQLEVVPGGRVRVRPVKRGRNDNWVRSGASWREIQYGAWRAEHPAGQLEVLRAVLAAYQANTAGYPGYGYGDATVHLDDLGPSLWHLLDRARLAGLDLVPARPTAGPVLLAEPVSAGLDLTSPDEGATLRPVVRAGERFLPAHDVQLIGDPALGLFVTGPAEIDVVGRFPAYDVESPRPSLVLAALDPAPGGDVDRLLRDGRELRIPAADLPRFLRSYYPAVRRAVQVVSTDRSVQLPEVAPPELAVTVTFRPDQRVGLDWAFSYRADGGVERVPLDAPPSTAVGEGAYRDVAAERALVDELDPATRRLMAPDLWLTGMDAVTFTRDQLPVLGADDRFAVELLGDPPEFREAETPPLIRISTTEADGGPGDADWFDLGVAVSVDGEEIPFDQLFVALAGEQSHLVLASGTYFALDRPELVALRRLIDEARTLQDRESDGLRISVFQAGLWEELLSLGVVDQQSARWAEAVQGLLDVEEIAPPPLPVGFDAQLRPYQLQGYRWLTFLWQHGLGGVLADDMGLGKTVQALAMVCHAREAQDEGAAPFLVVAPTSVVGNWVHEAHRFAPGLKVVAVSETVARRGTPLAEDVAGADLVVTSYALFRIDAAAYQGLAWAGLMLDEAQFVKNHQAKTYQCARRLPAPFKLAITGTPLENSLMDLWSLLSIVAPGLFPSPQRFSDVYRRPIERGDDPELLATLRRRVRPLMLRRTKDQVVADLPPKQEQVLDVVLNPRHQKIYQTHLQRERQKVLGLLDDLDKNRFAIFRSLTLLRQLALDPALADPAYSGVRASKVDAFLEQLGEVVDEGHRALVFSQFTGFLKVVRDRLDEEQIGYSYLDGRTRKRAERIAAFKTGDDPVFVISLKAGGVGLNLTEADYCFILDPWWNPAVEAQAVDRTHRIGQDKPVIVYRLVAVGTIEEKVMELKARKQALFSRVMDDDGLMSAPLSVEDIRGLLA